MRLAEGMSEIKVTREKQVPLVSKRNKEFY
jgi:hypothetical protein